MNIPQELHYSTDHEWVRVQDGKAQIGITDYAQDALGEVVFVEVPTVGDKVEAGQSFGEVESTKSVSDLFAPLGGTIVEINDALAKSPELLNEDPYGDGWICTIELDDPDSVSALLDAAAYQALTEA